MDKEQFSRQCLLTNIAFLTGLLVKSLDKDNDAMILNAAIRYYQEINEALCADSDI